MAKTTTYIVRVTVKTNERIAKPRVRQIVQDAIDAALDADEVLSAKAGTVDVQ